MDGAAADPANTDDGGGAGGPGWAFLDMTILLKNGLRRV